MQRGSLGCSANREPHVHPADVLVNVLRPEMLGHEVRALLAKDLIRREGLPGADFLEPENVGVDIAHLRETTSFDDALGGRSV